MKFLWTLIVFMGFLSTLFLLEIMPSAENSLKAKVSPSQDEYKQESLDKNKNNSEIKRSPSGLENPNSVRSLDTASIQLEIENSLSFEERSKKYFLENARIIHSWYKKDRSPFSVETQVILFEPKKKNKYALLRMEQSQENGSMPKYMVADHVMVTLADHASEADLEALMNEFGAQIRRVQPRSQIFLVEFNGEEKGQFEKVLYELNKRPDLIKNAEPDYLVSNL